MRSVRSVCLYFFLVFLGSALLAPCFYQLIHWLASFGRIPHILSDQPFPRYLNRTLMVAALIGLWPLARCLGIRSCQDLGITQAPHWWKESGRGFALGFLSLACAALMTVASGVRSLAGDHTSPEVARHLLNATSASLIVPCLEEPFFRGVLFGGLAKAVAWPFALVSSSIIYAGLHFVQAIPWSAPVDWTAGIVALSRMVRGFGDVEQFAPGFLNLTFAGIILGLAYRWTGTLYFSMGLHAGWIFWLKSYNFLTREVSGTSRWFWGTGKLIDGALVLIVLALLLAVLVKTKPKRILETPSKDSKHAP